MTPLFYCKLHFFPLYVRHQILYICKRNIQSSPTLGLFFGMVLLLDCCKSPFCFPTILLPRGIDSKRNPIMLDPLFLPRYQSFPRIDPADWKLPEDNQRVSIQSHADYMYSKISAMSLQSSRCSEVKEKP